MKVRAGPIRLCVGRTKKNRGLQFIKQRQCRDIRAQRRNILEGI